VSAEPERQVFNQRTMGRVENYRSGYLNDGLTKGASGYEEGDSAQEQTGRKWTSLSPEASPPAALRRLCLHATESRRTRRTGKASRSAAAIVSRVAMGNEGPRGHPCYFSLWAGGGVQPGRVIGESDARDEHPATEPITPVNDPFFEDSHLRAGRRKGLSSSVGSHQVGDRGTARGTCTA
jgi:hypothetical protein